MENRGVFRANNFMINGIVTNSTLLSLNGLSHIQISNTYLREINLDYFTS